MMGVQEPCVFGIVTTPLCGEQPTFARTNALGIVIFSGTCNKVVGVVYGSLWYFWLIPSKSLHLVGGRKIHVL